ncbi:MAG: hypothetical protein ACRDJP_13740 [Actinomycetota bacterium]
MVAFIASILGLALTLAVIVRYMVKRPVDEPLTWGEAMVSSTYVFFVMFLAYGIIPHQWLAWADNELKWRKDKLLLGPGDVIGQALPFEVSYEALRDLVAVGIYGVMLVLHVALWMIWQNRGKAKPAELPTSPYGRPLVRRTAG